MTRIIVFLTIIYSILPFDIRSEEPENLIELASEVFQSVTEIRQILRPYRINHLKKAELKLKYQISESGIFFSETSSKNRCVRHP